MKIEGIILVIVTISLSIMLFAVSFMDMSKLFPPDPVKEEVQPIIAPVVKVKGKEVVTCKELKKALELLSLIMNQQIDSIQTFSLPVTITAYSAEAAQTDSTPELTADQTPSRIGLLAVSRDLLHEIGLRYGQRVIIPAYGVFEIRDTMNKRFTRRVDILHGNEKAALAFGKMEGELIWMN